MKHQFKTRVNDLFDIRLPIVAGGMQWLSTAKFVATAAKSGMMGFLTAGSFSDLNGLRSEIQHCQDLCDGHSFGVNVSMLPKLVDDEITEKVFDVVIEEGVKFVETSGRNPEPYLPKLHAAGIKVLHKVPTVKHARKAQSVGVDAVTIVGAECGGHPGIELVGTFVQSAVAARDISIPLLVGGGIGTGTQIIAALALGADGVVIGTRFLVAEEIWAHRAFKERLIEADETETTLILQTMSNTMRVLRNKTTEIVQDLERKHGEEIDISILMPHISGKVGRSAYEGGDTTLGALSAGQGVAFVDRIEPLEEIVRRLEVEANRAMDRLHRLISD